MRFIVLTMMAAIASTDACAAYKCDNGGQIVYSDAPCGKVVGTLKQAPAPNYMDQLRAQRQSKTLIAISKHEVFVGMTADEVRQSWGSPTKINDTLSASGMHQQWVYRRGLVSTQYVYLENGVVTSISSN